MMKHKRVERLLLILIAAVVGMLLSREVQAGPRVLVIDTTPAFQACEFALAAVAALWTCDFFRWVWRARKVKYSSDESVVRRMQWPI